MSRRQGPPPGAPPEEPVVPIQPAIARTRAAYVRECIAKIQELQTAGKSADDIKESMSTFAQEYPTLFKKALVSASDPSLRTMLAMLDKMGTGQLSQHEASVVVGQRLHDIYIKPNLS